MRERRERWVKQQRRGERQGELNAVFTLLVSLGKQEQGQDAYLQVYVDSDSLRKALRDKAIRLI